VFYYKKLKQIKPSEANYSYKYGGALGMKALEVNKFKALGMIGEIKESFESKINSIRRILMLGFDRIIYQTSGIVGGSETKALKYSNELLKNFERRRLFIKRTY
jgi:hypothetical protein